MTVTKLEAGIPAINCPCHSIPESLGSTRTAFTLTDTGKPAPPMLVQVEREHCRSRKPPERRSDAPMQPHGSSGKAPEIAILDA